MFPLSALVVHPDDNIWRVPTFDPFDQAQKDVVIRLVERVCEGTIGCALADPPSTRSTHAVSHSRDHEKAVKVVQTVRP